METLIEFFETVPTSFRSGILIGGIFFFWVLEGVIPLFSFAYNKYRHAGINLLFTLFTAIIGFGLAGDPSELLSFLISAGLLRNTEFFQSDFFMVMDKTYFVASLIPGQLSACSGQ